MRTDQKRRIQELSSDLQKSGTFEAHAARELVMLLYEQTKESLVSADGNELYKTQGEARALTNLYKRLTVEALGKQE